MKEKIGFEISSIQLFRMLQDVYDDIYIRLQLLKFISVATNDYTHGVDISAVLICKPLI